MKKEYLSESPPDAIAAFGFKVNRVKPGKPFDHPPSDNLLFVGPVASLAVGALAAGALLHHSRLLACLALFFGSLVGLWCVVMAFQMRYHQQSLFDEGVRWLRRREFEFDGEKVVWADIEISGYQHGYDEYGCDELTLHCVAGWWYFTVVVNRRTRKCTFQLMSSPEDVRYERNRRIVKTCVPDWSQPWCAANIQPDFSQQARS